MIPASMRRAITQAYEESSADGTKEILKGFTVDRRKGWTDAFIGQVSMRRPLVHGASRPSVLISITLSPKDSPADIPAWSQARMVFAEGDLVTSNYQTHRLADLEDTFLGFYREIRDTISDLELALT